MFCGRICSFSSYRQSRLCTSVCSGWTFSSRFDSLPLLKEDVDGAKDRKGGCKVPNATATHMQVHENKPNDRLNTTNTFAAYIVYSIIPIHAHGDVIQQEHVVQS